MSKGITSIVFSLLVVAGTCFGYADDIYLQFSLSIDNGRAGTAGTVPDVFFAGGSTDANIPYDIKDLLHPPSPPGKHVRIYTSDTGVDLIRDYRPYDPNLPDLVFPIQLFAYDTNDIGLTGTSRLNLMNPSVLAAIPIDTLVYLRRYDQHGAFVEYHDLRNPDNHSVEWEAAEAKDIFARLELVVIDKCLAADIDGSGKVDLKDFAQIARYWLLYVPTSKRDADGDRFVGLDDLAIFAEKWLCDCYAKK